MNPQVSQTPDTNPTVTRKRRSLYPSSFPEPELIYDDTPNTLTNDKPVSNFRLWSLIGLLALALVFSAYTWVTLNKHQPSGLNHLFEQAKLSPNPDAFAFQSVEDISNESSSEGINETSQTPEPTKLTMGRTNPFDPIGQHIEEEPSEEDMMAEDDLMPTEDAEVLEYVGIITGDTASDSVAIIHLIGTGDDGTKLVELGNTFTVDEQTVRVQKITDRELHIVMNGTKKVLPLKEYVDALEPEAEESQNAEADNPSARERFRPNVTPQFSRSNR
jgi:hypothetical protein